MFLPSLLLRSRVVNYSEGDFGACFTLLPSSRWTQAFAIFISISPIMSSFQLLFGRIPNSVEKILIRKRVMVLFCNLQTFFEFFIMPAFFTSFSENGANTALCGPKNYRLRAGAYG